MSHSAPVALAFTGSLEEALSWFCPFVASYAEGEHSTCAHAVEAFLAPVLPRCVCGSLECTLSGTEVA